MGGRVWVEFASVKNHRVAYAVGTSFMPPIYRPVVLDIQQLHAATQAGDIMVSVGEINAYLNKLPARIAAAPLDEKIAYFAVIAGIALILIGVVTKIIF